MCSLKLLGLVFSEKLKIHGIISPLGLNIRVQSLSWLHWTTLQSSHCCVKKYLLVGVPSLFAFQGPQASAPHLLTSSKCSLLWEQISLTAKGELEAV
jgi:hypothetical protein